jgi:hypothetical protein
MFDIKTTAQELDQLLHDIVVKQGMFVPVKKTLLRYKNYALVKNQDGDWIVMLLVNGRKIHIATVFLKVTAFAVCKLHEQKKTARLDEVKNDDEIFRKNYINSVYYKKTVQTSTVNETRDNALWRYEIASAEAKGAKERIDRAFYSSLV